MNNTDSIIRRLLNTLRSYEGGLLPPRATNGRRVPQVANLQILKQTPTELVLTFSTPDQSGDIKFAGFKVLVSNASASSANYLLLGEFKNPPVIIPLPTATQRGIVKIQTMLQNGLLSDIDSAPTITFVS